MRYLKYLREDKIQDALSLPEPKVGEKYPKEKVNRYIKMIDAALNAMKNKEENDTNDSIVEDLRDKKKKWQNVDKETKPVKTKTEIPPEQQQENPPPGEEEQPPPQESRIYRVLEGKFRLGKKESKAFSIVSHINSWPRWYSSDVPQKDLIDEIMKKFKIDKSKTKNIFDIWHYFKDGRINLGDFQDYTHMILQGEKIRSL